MEETKKLRDPKDVMIGYRSLEDILKDHEEFLKYGFKRCTYDDKVNGMIDKRAILNHKNLSNVDLSHRDLSYAIIDYSNLEGADLTGTNLHAVNLTHSNLTNTKITDAYLIGVDFVYANLLNTDFTSSLLVNASFVKATLDNTKFKNSIINDCIFRDATICNAFFNDALVTNSYFGNIKLSDTDLNKVVPMACPSEGSFIGYKLAQSYLNINIEGFIIRLPVLVKLEIPEDAKRSSANTTKCRCDKAKVVSIERIDEEFISRIKRHRPNIDIRICDQDQITIASSYRDNNFIYKVGEMISVDDFDEDRWNECSTGIHFFIDRREAIKYLCNI